MINSSMDIKVELVGEEIFFTRPGTDFVLGCKKNPDSPNLFLHEKLGSSYRLIAPTPFRLRSPRRASSGGLFSPWATFLYLRSAWQLPVLRLAELHATVF